jgi:hypothetical protein
MRKEPATSDLEELRMGLLSAIGSLDADVDRTTLVNDLWALEQLVSRHLEQGVFPITDIDIGRSAALIDAGMARIVSRIRPSNEAPQLSRFGARLSKRLRGRPVAVTAGKRQTTATPAHALGRVGNTAAR